MKAFLIITIMFFTQSACFAQDNKEGDKGTDRKEQIHEVLRYNSTEIRKVLEHKDLPLRDRRKLISKLLEERAEKIRQHISEEERQSMAIQSGLDKKSMEGKRKQEQRREAFLKNIKGGYLKSVKKTVSSN